MRLDQDERGERKGVLSMSRKLALILACSVVSLYSFNVQALPVLSAPAQTAAPGGVAIND